MAQGWVRGYGFRYLSGRVFMGFQHFKTATCSQGNTWEVQDFHSARTIKILRGSTNRSRSRGVVLQLRVIKGLGFLGLGLCGSGFQLSRAIRFLDFRAQCLVCVQGLGLGSGFWAQNLPGSPLNSKPHVPTPAYATPNTLPFRV